MQVPNGTGQGVRREGAAPISKKHPCQMLFGKLQQFGKRSSSVMSSWFWLKV